MINQLIPSFNAGELSPKLVARTSLEKYGSGCQRLLNFIIMPYGGVNRRPGTEHLGLALEQCRVIGFNRSTSTRFVLELGDEYLRFWNSAGGQVMDPMVPADPLEVATPWALADLREIQYLQINDVMYLVHPLYPVQKLSRLADDEWTLEDVEWAWPPLLDENFDGPTITPSATTGAGITLTASAALFEAEHVGSYWQIAHRRSSAWVERNINANNVNSSSLRVLGQWEINTYGTWDAVVLVQRSYDNGSTWEDIRSYISDDDRNVTQTGTEEKECLLRIRVTNYVSNTDGRALLTAVDPKVYGLVQITAVGSSTSATADVVKDLYSTDATKLWAEGAFSEYRGYPRTVALHEGRVIYAGTDHRPGSLWGSVIDDFDNFRVGTRDDEGFYFTLATERANAINWMVPQGKLLLGTSGDEWSFGSPSSEDPITPTNVQARRITSYGSKYLGASLVGNVIFFTQREGRKIRELVYDFNTDGFVGQDLTLLSEHLTRGGIVETAYQQVPDQIYWIVTGQGELVGLTYERDQNVVGWHHHQLNGFVESVAVIPGGTGPDEVWVSVRREIDGNTVRHIERLKPDYRDVLEAQDKDNWWYVDAGVAVDITDTDLVPGLEHLEGQTVSVLVDGAVQSDRVVTDGAITLDEATSARVIAGLPYTSILQPMPLNVDLPDGSAQGRRIRVHSVVVKIADSLGGEATGKVDRDEWEIIPSRDTADPLGASPPPFTGDKKIVLAGDYQTSGQVAVRQRQPLPLTVLGLIPKWDAFGSA